jgi:hypothetical protein
MWGTGHTLDNFCSLASDFLNNSNLLVLSFCYG